MSTLTGVNLLSGLDPATVTLPSNFTLHALPKQDVWRKPESELFDKPAMYIQYGPMHRFKSAQVSICDFGGKRQFDQAGLIFIVNSPGPKDEKYEAWVKTGVEVYDTTGDFKVAAVSTPAGSYSDWSLVPYPSNTGKCATLYVEREVGGPAMFIYLLDGEQKILTRMPTWPFEEKFDKMLGVGVVVARHTVLPEEKPFTGEPLSAKFEGLKINWDYWDNTTSKYNV